MPVYNFVCPTCGERFETRLSFQQDLQNVVCPNGHTHVNRVYSVPTVVFKGSGFYVNDHRKSSTPNNNS